MSAQSSNGWPSSLFHERRKERTPTQPGVSTNDMAHGTRMERVGDQIRVELCALLMRTARDPEVRSVTVTRVRMTRDLQQARVYYTVLEDERGRRAAGRALQRARSFLRRQLGQRLRLRHVPELTFFYDDSVEQQGRIARIFMEIEAARPTADQSDPEAHNDRSHEGPRDT